MATVLEIQKRLNVLNYGPLTEDGIKGVMTTTAVKNFQRDNNLSVDGIVGKNTIAALFGEQQEIAVNKSGLKRIIMHWSAGGHKVSMLDKQHYHFIVSGSGEVVSGKHKPEDNISTSGGYAAHTLNCNTGSIGVSMAAMAGARDVPFNPGSQPITPVQLDSFAKLVAELSKEYDIPVSRQTVLSHAEVQPTLGIAQRGKWDIAWIPGMDKVGNPVEVGDNIREMIKNYL